MLIEKSVLKRDVLAGKTVLVTGAGGGIGFEAARNLVWMGAAVIIAEIDRIKGEFAAETINEEFGCRLADFYEIDIAEKNQIEELCAYIIKTYGFLDVIFNNATVTPLGTVDEVPIQDWDKSYAVNLRAPVLFARKFLPLMKSKNQGTIVFVPSSGAAPYMGAYEVFKTSQVELCNTIAAEVENTDICVYSIGPGLVKTRTAEEQIRKIAAYMGISADNFYEMNKRHMIDVESAGAGFAVSVAMAKAYNGQEIGSVQALMDAGIIKRDARPAEEKAVVADGQMLRDLVSGILAVYQEQYAGWMKRSLFERQWVLRDLKKVMRLSAEQVGDRLRACDALARREEYGKIREDKELFELLEAYWEHQLKLLKGYEKDPDKLQENSGIILGWIRDIRAVIDLIK